MNAPTPESRPSPRRATLTVIAEVALIVAALVFLARTAFDALRPPPPFPPPPKVDGMTWTSFANNHSAHFGFTNLTPDVRVACMKGIVTSTQTKISIESQVVCTGEVKPNTTVSFEASWPKGSPEDICYKESTFGKTLDWSKCDFSGEDLDDRRAELRGRREEPPTEAREAGDGPRLPVGLASGLFVDGD